MIERLAQLKARILKLNSFLCVGLDPDPNRFPAGIRRDAGGVLDFCREIIEATKQKCVAYKVNFAFFESMGAAGWSALEKVRKEIPHTHFSIADAKRGDIGNSSLQYAKAVFTELDFDSVTLSPYMGYDSIAPFLQFKGKYAILLALTSNDGSADFQLKKLGNGRCLYEDIIRTSVEWKENERLMYVVGATHPGVFSRVRSYLPGHFILVPGVGAQGGDLRKICESGMNAEVGLIVNSSRSILYASDGPDFARAAEIKAGQLSDEMASIMKDYSFATA